MMIRFCLSGMGRLRQDYVNGRNEGAFFCLDLHKEQNKLFVATIHTTNIGRDVIANRTPNPGEMLSCLVAMYNAVSDNPDIEHFGKQFLCGSKEFMLVRDKNGWYLIADARKGHWFTQTYLTSKQMLWVFEKSIEIVAGERWSKDDARNGIQVFHS